MQTNSNPTSDDLKPEHRPYQPHGAALDLFYSHDRECLLSGPAGTGKSLCALSKIYLCCEKYPGIRCLIVRKTRESLTESALVTWENQVIPEGSPLKRGAERRNRQSYKFTNGSEVIVAGLRQSHRDNTQKVMSTEYDAIYVMEAIELAEQEWEQLTTRLRHNKMPYQQLLADTNPASPQHWLKKRCDTGKTAYIESRHEDNPTLFDRAANKWTAWGEKYIRTLDELTGARRQRLRFGRWVQAEGVVYEGWDSAVNIIDRFEIPKEWPRYLSIDFGFTNPFVAQWYAADHDGRLYLYRELVRVKTLVEDHAKSIKHLHGSDPKPVAVICDHDAEDRATLERHLGWSTTKAVKDVSVGIQELASRLQKAADGRPRFMVFGDALVAREPMLDEAKKPIGFAEEVDGYIWQDESNQKIKEEPLKVNDHSMDAARYAVMHFRSSPKWVPVTPPKPVETKKWLPGTEKPKNNPFFMGSSGARR